MSMRAQRHREIMAEFSAKAVGGAELDVLLREACLHTAEGLCVERAKVLEYRPDTDDLLVRAGIGWAEGVVGHAALPADIPSPAGRAFLTGEGVFIEDITSAPGFEYSELLRQHDIISLANVPIKTSGFTFGVLEADATESRQFTEDDRNFLLGFANLLAAAVQRQRTDAERERLVQDLAEAKDAAEAAVASKSRVLAATGHDLKQPLQVIVMSLDRLRARMVDPVGQRDVSRATHATARLTQGLDNLLAVARIESGVLEPRNETVDLGTLLTEFAEQCRPIAEQKGLLLRLVPTKARIQTDVQLLGHILQNLISNAIKYTEKGRILIGCRRRRGMILIEVHDSGIGIPAEHLDRIFEEFHRVDGSRSDGLGLGLAIAKRMAVLMGHRLTVRSRPGKGTCFSVEVPLVEGQIP